MPQILVVEDEVPIRENFHATLEFEEVDVRSVAEGFAGVYP